jgi:Cu/Ag efflux protein CusF
MTARSTNFGLLLVTLVSGSIGLGWLPGGVLPASSADAPRSPAAAASSATPRVWSGRGVIKSFGKSRAYVNIAHEAIDGLMGAMTMAFDAPTPSMLDGFAAGDAVSFSFTQQADGGFRLVSLTKR